MILNMNFQRNRALHHHHRRHSTPHLQNRARFVDSSHISHQPHSQHSFTYWLPIWTRVLQAIPVSQSSFDRGTHSIFPPEDCGDDLYSSRKHPYYLNGRFVFLMSSQIALACTFMLRNVMLDRFAFRVRSLASVRSFSYKPSFVVLIT